MADENRKVIERWFEEVWNQKREDAIDEMFAADGIANGLADDGGPLIGPEAFKVLHRAFVDAYPNMTITIEDTISEGDLIAARCTVTGQHDGHGIRVAPTNRPVTFTGMTFCRIKDGQIVEAWNEFNFMEMYRQVGALNLSLE
jgi:predicted ester cyclase